MVSVAVSSVIGLISSGFLFDDGETGDAEERVGLIKPGTFDDLVHCTTDICRYWLDRNRIPHTVQAES